MDSSTNRKRSFLHRARRLIARPIGEKRPRPLTEEPISPDEQRLAERDTEYEREADGAQEIHEAADADDVQAAADPNVREAANHDEDREARYQDDDGEVAEAEDPVRPVAKRRPAKVRPVQRGSNSGRPAPQQMWETVQPYVRQYWWAGVAGLALVVFLVPWFIAHTPVVTWMIDGATADMNGRVSARSASLGWFSPVVLRGVEVRDKQGQTVMEAARLTGDKSLWSLLSSSSRLGKFRLEQPKLHLVLRDNGSNVEDVLAKYLDPKKPASGVDLVVEVVDGAVTVEEPRTKRTWEINEFQFSLVVPADAKKPLDGKASGVVPQGRQSGKFEAALKLDRTAGQRELSDQLTVKTEGLPLELLEPVARRVVPKAELAGRLAAQLDCRWSPDAEHRQVVVKGELTGENLLVAGHALGNDRPSLAKLHATGKVAWQDGRLECERVEADSDFGSMAMAGTLDWRDVASGNLATLLHQEFEIGGRLDLAKLAAALPGTLRIRQATQVTGGQVQLALASRRGQEAGAKGMAWLGKLQVSDVTAVRNGRKLVWQQPIQVTLDAMESTQGPVIKTLHCDSSFLQVRAGGTPELMTVTAMFDLSKLANQSSGFVDHGGLRAQGEGSARLGWERKDRQTYQVTAGFSVLGLQMSLPDRPGWREERLAGDLAATVATDFTNYRVDAATLRLETGTDFSRPCWLDFRLTQPVSNLQAARSWPLAVRGQGQVASWYARTAAYLPVAEWKVGGTYELTGDVTWSPGTVTLGPTRVNLANFQVDTPTLAVREPKADVTLAGRWDYAQRRWDVELASLTSGSVAMRADNVVYAPSADGTTRLSGIVQCEALLDHLQQWVRPTAPAQPKWNIAGKVYGRTDIEQVGSIISARFNSTVTGLVAQPPSGQRFQEPEVRLAGRGTYNDVSRSFVIEQAELTSNSLAGNGTGRVSQVKGAADMQFNGKVDYDWDRLGQLLRAQFGEGIRVAGRGSSPLVYRGPWSSEAQVVGGFGWSAADVYGFQVGPGELQATFARGSLDVQPMRLSVSEGQVQLAPRIRLAGGPREFTLEAGRIADNVRINPTMCSYGLQYVAPVLAGVAAAEGRFSIELDRCRIPLDTPAKGELNGKLVIHSVQIGPGHLTQEIAQVLGRATPAQLSRESVVPFQLTEGRIYHKNLELVFPDITIRTQGSVGLDQTLALMAEMPIPARLQNNTLVGTAVKDQVLRLPIAGTLYRPQIDRAALQQATQGFVRTATNNVIEAQLNKQINRVLGPLAPNAAPAATGTTGTPTSGTTGTPANPTGRLKSTAPRR